MESSAFQEQFEKTLKQLRKDMNMKKLGVQITAFNEERFIRPVCLQFKDSDIKIVVAVSLKSWNGNLKAGNTFSLVPSRVDLMSTYSWKDEAEQRNWCMENLDDCDYVLVCHADTFFTQEDIQKIKDFIQTATERQYDIQTKMYWKDLDTVVQPDPILKAMLIRKDVRFVENIRIEDQVASAPIVPDVICHHLSWAKTDEEIKTKIATYGHANEIVPSWYEEVWLKDQDYDFAPTNPTDYKYKVHYSCPEEIRRYFETT